MLLRLMWKVLSESRRAIEDFTLDFCLAKEKKNLGLSLMDWMTFDSLNLS